MKRKDLQTIIKARSAWKVDKRRGDYRLPNGERLSDYLTRLVYSQLALDSLAIARNGNAYFCEPCEIGGSRPGYRITPPFCPIQYCTLDDHERRVEALVRELIQ